jgi:hypothetical protein
MIFVFMASFSQRTVPKTKRWFLLIAGKFHEALFVHDSALRRRVSPDGVSP